MLCVINFDIFTAIFKAHAIVIGQQTQVILVDQKNISCDSWILDTLRIWWQY